MRNYIQWSPIPIRPWGVHEPDGRIIRRFDTAAQAQAHLNKIEPLTETQRDGGARFERQTNPDIDY